MIFEILGYRKGRKNYISRKAAKGAKNKNSKHEIRNSKQIQMTKISQIPNKLFSDSVFWIFPILDSPVSAFVSDFDIRISDLCRSVLARKIC